MRWEIGRFLSLEQGLEEVRGKVWGGVGRCGEACEVGLSLSVALLEPASVCVERNPHTARLARSGAFRAIWAPLPFVFSHIESEL